MKLTRLKGHPVFETASAGARGYIAKCHPTDRNKDPRATVKESYAIETFLLLTSIVRCVDQLYFSVEMLTGYRANNTPENMNRYDYIVFGIENYYLRITSAYDRCLRLTNFIFQIGLPDRECREATITKNAHIKGTPVAKALKDLDKFTSQFRFHRNMVAHKSTYSEEKLNKLGSYYYLIEEEEKEFKKYHHLYKRETDKYIADKKAAFQENVKQLENLIEEFFDSIYNVFKSRLESYYS